MTEHRLRKGTIVQVIADGPMGTLDRIGAAHFADEVVRKGDRGTYWGTNVNVPGWHFVEFEIDGETRYCPLPGSAFREWRPNTKSSPGTEGLARLLP